MIHGFKELASVCHSIAQGQQTVLLRKAGIRESTHDSAFQHQKRCFSIID